MADLNHDFNQVIRKTKVKRIISTILITLVTTILLLGGTLFATHVIKQKKAADLSARLNFLRAYTYPNIRFGSDDGYGGYGQTLSLAKGTKSVSYYKPLGNYQVDWGRQDFTFDLFTTNLISVAPTYFNQFPTQKTLHLYDPAVAYINLDSSQSEELATPATLPQEIPLISTMKGKIVEVGLSFSKPLTYAEVTTLIPAELTQEWVYLTLTASQPETPEIIYPDGLNMLGNFWGFSLVDENNSRDFKKAYTEFSRALKEFNRTPKKTASTYLASSPDFKELLKMTQEKKAADIKLNGIVLSGRAEDFALLKENKLIRASSLGASIEENPVVPYTANLKE